ncbi:MAG: phosphoglycerate dehydrogenase [Treponema sp.]|jgi:D-3-phosphoglycerate dehydrogenase|nr:phosphoglycerate dehydrogenase [Treponema sp.]
MKKIFITVPAFDQYCQDAKKLLEDQGYEVVVSQKNVPFHTFEELKPIIGEYDGVIMGLDEWNDEVFKIAPRLKAVAKFGVGVDNVDLAAAAKRGIKVINAKGGNSQAVAELALALMLASARNIVYQHERLTGAGEWVRFTGMELSGKTIGLLGFGDIARRVAKLLTGFEVKILAADPLVDAAAAARHGASLVSVDEVLSQSDIVSIHIPAVADNYHFMNAERFQKIKKGAILINTARGAVLDEEALLDALHSGQISAAALDVYEHEPIDNTSPLTREPRIICTPHTAAETLESIRGVGYMAAKDLIEALEGRTPVNWVNRW